VWIRCRSFGTKKEVPVEDRGFFFIMLVGLEPERAHSVKKLTQCVNFSERREAMPSGRGRGTLLSE